MGEGKARRAKIYTKLIVFYTFVILFVLSILLYIFRHSVALFFTNQPELLELTTQNYKMISLFLIVHGIGMAAGGALRGMGK